MNVILFGFTGLGNAVFRGLLKRNDVTVKSVFTKKYPAAYPFYPEIQIEELCNQVGIRCYNDLKVNSPVVIEMIKNELPDLLIVSSFNQIFTKSLIDIPTIASINFHPSLLPIYRGPCPEQSVILNGEKETGISVHYISEKIDGGNIIVQKRLPLDKDENYSSLKKKVADASEAIVPEVIDTFSGKIKPEGIKQDESKATYHKRPVEADCYLETESSVINIMNKVRALNPFPGTSLQVNGNRINVDRYELLKHRVTDKAIGDDDSYIDVWFNSEGIRLFKKK